MAAARAILMATAASIAALGCRPTRTPETPTGPHVTVMTYNVNVGGPRPDLAAEAIRDSGADIVCLQETSPAWERFLRPRLKAAYRHMRFRHYGGAGGLAFLSRWPLRDRVYGRPEAGWFPGWAVEAATPVGPVQILNVHLRPPVSERGSVGPSPYLATKSIRLKEIQTLRAQLEPRVPTIVLGDFNEDDSGRAVSWLREQGMRDALREFDRHTNTWRWRTRYHITLRDRLDHILYSDHLHCLAARVIPGGASDHLPLVAVLERARRGEAARRVPAKSSGGEQPSERRRGQTQGEGNRGRDH